MTVFDLKPSSPEAKVRHTIDLALELADAVARNDRGDVQCAIDRADPRALCLVLAAMVDDERSIRGLLRDVPQLLRWMDSPRVRPRKPLQPCGTHAAFSRHRARGEEPDELCREAERAYQRARDRIRKVSA
jgi:hypothetical protein